VPGGAVQHPVIVSCHGVMICTDRIARAQPFPCGDRRMCIASADPPRRRFPETSSQNLPR
jgi:hypothetical protein